MDIQIGPHLYRNSNGTIEVEGVPQIDIEPRPSGGFPKVNFAIFDNGKNAGQTHEQHVGN